MIDRQQLLADLKPLVKAMEADLRARCDEVAEINDGLKKEYDQARAADRTGVAFEEWRADLITQVAVAWVLSCVFVRFLEDNRLIEPPRISGVTGQSSVGICPSSVGNTQLTTDHGPLTTDDRLQRARDERETYFKRHPRETDRDYLLAVFDDLAKLPGTKDVFGPHNPVSAYRDWLSGDAAQTLIEFFQRIDADGTGEIVHDFADPDWDTRFLGDLYQDLSEAARKKYALLQTPVFVEEFILDRTLEPAIKEFGLIVSGPSSVGSGRKTTDNGPRTTDLFKMIDPACGSGHFLLGAFARILKHWRAKEPGTSDRQLVNRALAAVHGVDLNPYAVAIARFRLLVAAMREYQITRLDIGVPDFKFNLVCGDSLLHGAGGQQVLGFHELAHHYHSEDLDELRRILKPGQYHAVVANPPYITVKDKALNQAYRERYPRVCHRQYSLAVPFLQRLFDLAVSGQPAVGSGQSAGADDHEPRTTANCQLPTDARAAGYVGQITANSFMKREFGKKLVESYLPQIDLTHVIDTSGAYIPGHGTPTVILLGRNRRPVAPAIRAVMGIKGEPATPDDPARGLVWTAICQQIDHAGSQSIFVSVNDTPREQFRKHPWSIGGGGAAELKERLDSIPEKLDTNVRLIGRIAHTGDDDAYIAPRSALLRRGIDSAHIADFVEGDRVRDYAIAPGDFILFPYDERLCVEFEDPRASLFRWLWYYRTELWERREPNGNHREIGKTWQEYSRFHPERFFGAGIAIAFVATHNHFVLDAGSKVFKQSAPVIRLPVTASEDDHLALLGLLDSSTACFWMKQVAHNKGSTVDDQGARQRTAPFEDFFEFTSTQLGAFPLPQDRPVALARRLDLLAQALSDHAPSAVLGAWSQAAEDDGDRSVCLRDRLDVARSAWASLRGQMISLQEELDWHCYRLYGLTEEDLTLRREDAKENKKQDLLRAFAPSRELPPLQLGQRAFEIVLARKMAAGDEETTWFARHGSTPITELPAHWPEAYRQVVERRIESIETDRNIGLIERPEYKRRWNTEPWESQLARALRGWLLDRLESYFDVDGRMSVVSCQSSVVHGEDTTANCQLTTDKNPRPLADIQLVSVAQVADVARVDGEFMQVAELFTGRLDFDIGSLVAELVAAESVPALPVLRYKPSGLDKRAAWERTWDLQRLEDAVDALFEELNTKARRHEEIELSHPVPSCLRDFVFRPIQEAAKYLAEAVAQHLDLTSDTVLQPVQDAAKRAKKAAVGDIPVPPKYTSADFRSSNHWRLRGKLDVPKERWVSFPFCEGEDGTLVIAWAGYDHLQLARAIAERYELAKEQEGRKLVPLLAAIGQLIPWLKQWHNDLDPVYGTRMGDYFESYLAEEAKALDMTVEQVMAWTPPEKAKGRGRKRK